MAAVTTSWIRRISGAVLARSRAWLVASAVSLLAFSSSGSAQGTREYDLKAVFIFRFASFVEWPDSAFRSPDEPLVIGILGKDPFGGALEDVVRSETARNRPIQVRRFADIQDVRDCHILFVSRSEAGRVSQIVRALHGRPILLVSDIDRFPAEGGMIGFTTAESRVQLAINVASVRDAGLTVSSKLLRLARVIGG